MKKLGWRVLIFVLFMFMMPGTAFADSAGNEAQIYSYLVNEMGINSAAACGVLSNIYYESSFNPNALGDGGTSYGICQWHNSRWDNLKRFCSNNGYSYTTLQGQLHYLEYELQSSYTGTWNYLHSVSNTGDGAYDAGYYWCYYFEVPANRASKSVTRGNRARDVYWPKYNAVPDFDVDPRYPTPFKAYPADGGRTTVYDGSLSAYSNHWIDGTDLCTVEAVYTNGYAKVSYPTSSSTFTAYVALSSFVPSGVGPYSYSPSQKLNSYTRSDMGTAFGSVFTTDSCVVVGKSGELLQLIYPVSGGYKLGWVDPGGIIPDNPDPRFPVPIIAYNSSGDVRTTVYRSTSSMGGDMYGQIFVDDRCTINAVSVAGNWVNVTYPVSGGTKTGYVYLDQFFPAVSGIPDLYTSRVSSNTPAYRKADMATSIGEVYTSDTITVVGRSGGLYQVMYPVTVGSDSGKYKLAWIDGAALVKDLRGITVTSNPSKLSYLEGQGLNTSGLRVTATYADGTTGDVTSSCSVSGYDSTPGTKTVTVSYQGKTSAFTVLVVSKSPTSLTISQLPNSLVCELGEQPDATGIRVTASYDNGTVEDVTDRVSVTLEDSQSPGRRAVEVSYVYNNKTVTTTYEVEVLSSGPDLSKDGWVDLGSGKKGYAKGGKLVTGWMDLDGAKYWFHEDGAMATGWTDVTDSAGKTFHYYFNPASCNLVRGTWFEIDGYKYYFRPSGNVAHGWATISDNGVDKKYWFDDDYHMVTGWRDIDNGQGQVNHYYFRPAGSMATGWATIDGQKYWFRPSGNMATGFTTVDDGYKRYFDNQGHMLVGWRQIDGKTFYFRASGAMQTGEMVMNGVTYVFTASGTLSSVLVAAQSDEDEELVVARAALDAVGLDASELEAAGAAHVRQDEGRAEGIAEEPDGGLLAVQEDGPVEVVDDVVEL